MAKLISWVSTVAMGITSRGKYTLPNILLFLENVTDTSVRLPEK